ncbi:tRNA 2-thiouridine(34) synthase MnmA [Acetobacterium paludosum]|nr:tRNA 2-thiouridine(34) synthase MnmA [Acetobacterium paludosum]
MSVKKEKNVELMSTKKVIVGLSGGIDSTASAYQLIKEGYEVIGVTFDFFGSENTLTAAGLAAERLGIKHHIVHAQRQFQEKVIEPFIEGYKKGQTPNPCLLCNREMKFKLLTEFADRNDYALIATGHYAEVVKVGDEFKLLASLNQDKDQSYFLYHLDQNVLSRLLFPLDCFRSKDAVRQTIKELLPELSAGNESQGICFIPKKNHTLFLKEAVFGLNPTLPGNFVDTAGKILGIHRGIHGFTLGQTRGLGIKQSKRLVVIDIIPETNTVVLDEEAALFKNEIWINHLYLHLGADLTGSELTFKTCRWGNHYHGNVECLNNGQAIIHCREPVRAPTPGQALVFYQGRQVLGGGIIKKNLI